MRNYITAESFGSDIPENWEEIAEYLNGVIDDLNITEDHEAVNELWEAYWSGEVRWYAVMNGADDTDWGFGSYDIKKAKKMLANYPGGYIAVIDNNPGHDAYCDNEIRE